MAYKDLRLTAVCADHPSFLITAFLYLEVLIIESFQKIRGVTRADKAMHRHLSSGMLGAENFSVVICVH